jgi:5'-3' exoribonuclease 1
MNGKKQEWEAVVKIPFIDGKRLVEAMATKEHGLSEDERIRNSFGVTLKFTYSDEVDYVYPSSMAGFFPDIDRCRCVENIFELPTMDGLEVYVGLMDGALLGTQALAGFPSFKTLSHVAQAGFHGVTVFQQESRNESMIVTIRDTQTEGTVSAAQSRLGKAVYVGYPFLQEAKVVKVIDEMFDYSLDENGLMVTAPHNYHQIEDWKKTSMRIEKMYSKKLGIIIGDVESLVYVEMLKGLVKKEDGSTVKEYAPSPGQDMEYATQTIVDEVYNEDPRFLEEAARPVEEEFPIGTRLFFLGSYAYGRPVVVDGHVDGKVSVSVLTLPVPDTEFGHHIARKALTMTRYTPSFAVAKSLRLHPLALSKLTSALSVESNGLRLNLGLNLKFQAKGLKVLGYSRKSNTGWEFSDKAIELISQYMLKFPEFVAGIAARPQGDIYVDTDFYPADEAKAKIKEVVAWLKSIQTKSFEAVPLEAEQLDSDAVGEILQAARVNMSKQEGAVVIKQMKGVPRNALLSSIGADRRIGDQRFSLGDRVVYVLASGKVPIAQRGTVVGVTRTARMTWLDIVFDASFMSGTNLGERCDPFHGATVPSNSVLNLSTRQCMAGSKAEQARRPQAPAPQPFAARGYGMPVGPNGQGQLVPASVPAPLQGSFRNAATGGQHNGRGTYSPRARGRGRPGLGAQPESNGHQQQFKLLQRQENVSPWQQARGGGGRGGFSNGGWRGGRGGIGAAGQGQQQQQQSYNAMPPPPSLLGEGARGRGRGGRGFPRVRGDGGRGRGRGAAKAAE